MSGPTASSSPYWWARNQRPPRPAVAGDADFDAVVIGGGLTGITSAYLLKRAGLRVALVEADRCSTGDSGQTSAHLTYVSDKPLLALVEGVGRDSAQALWEASWAALRTIGDVVVQEGIECGFAWTPGYLHLPIVDDPNRDDRARLAAESELALDLGFDATFVEQAPLVGRPAIRFEKQARFEPLQYAHALIDLIDGGGSVVFESSPVSEIVPDLPAVVVRGHRLRCQDVVIATHLPTVAQPALVHAAWADGAMALFTSYVIAAEVPRGSVPDALFWDTGDPYRYLRVEPGSVSDVVIFGGYDHRTDEPHEPAARYAKLERDLRRLVPHAPPSHRWYGEVIVSSDGLPVIGSPAPHQFVATGFNGNGIILGTVAAIMAADTLTGRRSPWRDLFAADRPALREPAGDSLKGGA